MNRREQNKERTVMEVPQEGKYICKLNGQLVIYEASTGSLCGALPCVVAAPPAYEGFTFKHTMVLVKADGTIQTRTTDTLKAVFGWDGRDPFWLMDNSVEEGAMRSVEFEIVGGPETGDKGGIYFKSQWLNPLGGGMRTPVAADRRSVLAKYGSKFQAVAGVSAPVGHGTAVPQTAPKIPTVPRSAPIAAPQVATATMEGAWATLNESQTGKAAEDIEKMWFDTIARLFPNKSNTDLKPHEWGKLKAEFEDYIPM
jgi:hypothetical protein